jgi:RNA polymerase-binding transcription factor DksA
MPLTGHQRAELAQLIEQRWRALVAELREDAARNRDAPYAEHAGNAPDSGDQSVADLLADLGEAETTRDLEELRGLEAARERLKGADCGVCSDCRADIGIERLKASPAALRCVRCQERHERTYAGAPSPSI